MRPRRLLGLLFSEPSTCLFSGSCHWLEWEGAPPSGHAQHRNRAAGGSCRRDPSSASSSLRIRILKRGRAEFRCASVRFENALGDRTRPRGPPSRPMLRGPIVHQFIGSHYSLHQNVTAAERGARYCSGRVPPLTNFESVPPGIPTASAMRDCSPVSLPVRCLPLHHPVFRCSSR